MSRKKSLSFIKILFGVFGTSFGWIVFVLIPAGLQIYEFFGGSVNVFDQLPSWIWFVPLLIYIVYVLIRTIFMYRKELEKDEGFDITPIVRRNDQWVSVDIPNPLNKPIECYCILNSVEVDGIVRDDIKTFVTEHTSRVSWSGGDTKGKTEGVKLIDRFDTLNLNIVTPTHNGLRFEMAKGGRDLGYDMQYGAGKYKVNLELNYKCEGDKEYQTKINNVKFVCYIEKSESKSDSTSNIIRSDVGAKSLISFGGEDEVNDSLCVRIINGNSEN